MRSSFSNQIPLFLSFSSLFPPFPWQSLSIFPRFSDRRFDDVLQERPQTHDTHHEAERQSEPSGESVVECAECPGAESKTTEDREKLDERKRYRLHCFLRFVSAACGCALVYTRASLIPCRLLAASARAKCRSHRVFPLTAGASHS